MQPFDLASNTMDVLPGVQDLCHDTACKAASNLAAQVSQPLSSFLQHQNLTGHLLDLELCHNVAKPASQKKRSGHAKRVAITQSRPG